MKAIVTLAHTAARFEQSFTVVLTGTNIPAIEGVTLSLIIEDADYTTGCGENLYVDFLDPNGPSMVDTIFNGDDDAYIEFCELVTTAFYNSEYWAGECKAEAAFDREMGRYEEKAMTELESTAFENKYIGYREEQEADEFKTESRMSEEEADEYLKNYFG